MCPYFERHEYFSVALMRMMLIGCQRFLSSSAAKEIANASQFSLYIYFHINEWVWLVGIFYLQFLVWNGIHQMRLSFDYISFMQIVFLGHKNLNLIIFCKCNKLSFCSGQKQPLFCHQQCFIALMKCDFGYVSLETDKKRWTSRILQRTTDELEVSFRKEVTNFQKNKMYHFPGIQWAIEITTLHLMCAFSS